MIEADQLQYLGFLLLAATILLGFVHIRPYTFYSASPKKIRIWAIVRTILGLGGLGLIIWAGYVAPKTFDEVFFYIVVIILFPLLYQFQLNSYKEQLAKFKRYDELIKNKGVYQKSRWWLLFNRDLPSLFSSEDRRFWIDGFDGK